MTHPIPDEALLQHIAILAKTGAGKTYLAKTIAERLLKAGRRLCVIDPTGGWWGLRSNASGRGPGFPIVVFGGQHADIELHESHGAALAEIIGGSSTPAIIDTSQLLVGQRVRFFTAFAENLLRTNRGPLHLIIDEAHIFAPQGKTDIQGGQMLHAANNLVSLGRSRGLRIILVTQRGAKLHKDSLTQIETLVAMRVLSPQDRAAIQAWIKDNASVDQGKEVIESLAKLKVGEGWIWAPELDVLKRVKFPSIETFDSSSAPADGIDYAKVQLAPIDRDAIAARLTAVKADAFENDPKRLKEEISRLKREAAKAGAIDPEALSSADRRGYERGFAAGIAQEQERAALAFAAIKTAVQDRIDAFRSIKFLPARPPVALSAPKAPIYRGNGESPQAAPIPAGTDKLTGQQARVADALRFWLSVDQPTPSREQVAAVAGYSARSGNFRNVLSNMKTSGLIDYPADNLVRLVADAGADLTTAEARDRVMGVLSGPEAKVAKALSGCMSREDVAEAAEYSAASGNFRNILSRLHTMTIIEYPATGQVQLSEWAKELIQ
jgi:hypothetical protein